jgi:hypothetical protein
MVKQLVECLVDEIYTITPRGRFSLDECKMSVEPPHEVSTLKSLLKHLKLAQFACFDKEKHFPNSKVESIFFENLHWFILQRAL